MRTPALVLTLLLAAPVHAGGDDADPDLEIARRHFDKGARLYSAERYPEAIQEFELAIRYRAAPELYYNLARAHDRLEQFEEAAQAYERFLAANPPAATAQEVRDRLTVIQPRVEEARRARTGVRHNRRLRFGLAIGFAVAGAAALVAAGTLFGVTRARVDELAAGDCRGGCPPALAGEIDGLRAQAKGSYATFGLAGALLLVDIGLWAWTSHTLRR